MGGLACGLVILLAATLRFEHYRGNDPPDDSITIDVVGHMRQSGSWDDNWAKAHLRDQAQSYNQYNFSSYIYSTFLFYKVVKGIPGTLAWRSEDDGNSLYHFWSALLATLAVVPVMALARRASGPAAALGAGVLTAASLILVQDAHYIRPEAFCACLTLLCLCLSWPSAPLSPWRIGLAAVGIGLLVACKVSLLLLVWVPAVPVLAVWGSLPSLSRLRWAGLVVAGLAVGFIVGVPYAFVHPTDFLYGVSRLTAQYAGAHPPHSHVPPGWVLDLLFFYTGKTLGWPLVAAAGLGLALLAGRRQWVAFALVGGPVILFGGYFSTRSVFFERNLSHVAPCFFILAAIGAIEAARWAAGRLRLPAAAVAAVLVALLVVPSLRLTYRLDEREFSGVNVAAFRRFDEGVHAAHPGIEWWPINFLTNDPLYDLKAHFRYGETPVILRITDYGDDGTAANLRVLKAELVATRIAEYDGTFDQVPVSTLRTYFVTHTLYFLVTGVKPE